MKHENVYLVAITKSNANAGLVFEFLYRLVGLGRGYFGKLDEEAVKNNFVLVYELLDGRCGGVFFLKGEGFRGRKKKKKGGVCYLIFG